MWFCTLYNIPALIRWVVSRLLGVVSSLRLDQFHPDQYSIQSQGLDPGKSKTDWLSTHSHTSAGAGNSHYGIKGANYFS